jgi:predicted XRE-type DNA-binding protein
MATTLREKLASLPIERREKIEAKAQQLIAEKMSLQSLWKARLLTQEKVAELLDIRQENVSRIEKRADLLISTLRDYVGSMGGELHLIVEFPDYPPIELSGFGEVEAENLLPRNLLHRKKAAKYLKLRAIAAHQESAFPPVSALEVIALS